jgi:hypothetical protein
LKRLGLAHRARAVLDIDKFLPAPGQGAIAITARGGDTRVLEALNAISDRETSVALTAERAFLAELEGSCRHADRGPRPSRGGRLSSGRKCCAPTARSASMSPARSPRRMEEGSRRARRRARTRGPPARRRAGQGWIRRRVRPQPADGLTTVAADPTRGRICNLLREFVQINAN